MTQLIHKYLNEYYILEGNRITTKNKSIYSSGSVSYIYITHTLDIIIKELSKIFGLTKKQLKYYIKGWVRKQNRGFDFEKYWNPTWKRFTGGISLPLMQPVISRTIGMLLARVEPMVPMEPPRGILNYMDAGYPEYPDPAIRRVYANRQIDTSLYGTTNISHENQLPELQVDSTENERRQRLIQIWSGYLNQQGIIR